jgi:hypothetical protein
LVGILRWIVEIGRVDLAYSTSILSSYMCAPRMGHLQAALHVFGYLKNTSHYSLLLSPSYPDVRKYKPIDISRWKEFYPHAKEEIPPGMPKPLANGVIMTAFVDSDHAGDEVDRRSHTGIVIYLNKAPVMWYSKKQATVETSSYGSELVALRIATELIEGIRYKLRSFGIPLCGPTFLFCDNQSVVYSSAVPESSLRRRHNSVAYHKVRESAASDAIAVFKASSEENIADICTKRLGGPKTKLFCGAILYTHI